MPDLPRGTITFLFTDVEGSTKLWDEHPEAMRSALARHDELIEALVARHGGTVVRPRGEGDSRFAVFTMATDAAAAASAIQLALHAEPWPAPVALMVRMGLHTGEADLRAGDYYGTAVNRCARLRSLAHGGQVLCSEATTALVRERLPEGVTLVDLGCHTLQGLSRSEHLFQLCPPGVRVEFPPLPSAGAIPNNLPAQLTGFVGRERQMAQLAKLLAASSLLTLTGVGGAGKTRLALQLAAEHMEGYPDGVWLVELASVTDPGLVPHAVGSTLGLPLSTGDDPMQAIARHCAGRVLIVLDNCEHVVGAVAGLVGELRRTCRDLTVLATSREALGTADETVFRVPPLSVPDPARLPAVEEVRAFGAVRLFEQRSSQTNPGFHVTDRNATAVAQICLHLDGIPLAIELAAGLVTVLSPQQIASRLDDRFRLLVGGRRGTLPHHQTLGAALEWGYDLLSPGERILFRRLAVFIGSFPIEGVEAVCSGSDLDRADVLPMLSRLVNKSLVIAEERDEVLRYRLLETVREYARTKVIEAAEDDVLRGRYLNWFLSFGSRVAAELSGKDQMTWLTLLESERDKLDSLLRVRFEQDPTTTASLVCALADFWVARGYLSEGRMWAERALRSVGTAPSALRAEVLSAVGTFAFYLADAHAAGTLLEECLRIRRELGDRLGSAEALNVLGAVAHQRGDYETARALLEDGVSIARELGNERGVADGLNNCGTVAVEQGDYEAARALYEESLSIQHRLEDQRGVADGLSNLGVVAQAQGDLGVAAELYEESLRLRRVLGDRRGIANSLGNLGKVTHRRGDAVSARILLEEALGIERDLGDPIGTALMLDALGMVAHGEGKEAEARLLCEEGLALAREVGAKQLIVLALKSCGTLAEARGDRAVARDLFSEGAGLARQLADRREIAALERALADLG